MNLLGILQGIGNAIRGAVKNVEGAFAPVSYHYSFVTPTPKPSPTPTSTPTSVPNSQNFPQTYASQELFNPDSNVILKSPIATSSAEQYTKNFFQKEAPNSPMNTPHNINTIAQTDWINKLSPFFIPALAKIETNALQPPRLNQTQLAKAIQNSNFANVLINGQEYNYGPLGGLDYSIPRYAHDITSGWTGSGWDNFRENPTIRNFIYAQNPSDNPEQEIQNMVNVANESSR